MCSFKTMAGYLKSAHAVAEEEMCATSEVEASGPAMTCHAVVGAEIASSGELRLRAHWTWLTCAIVRWFFPICIRIFEVSIAYYQGQAHREKLECQRSSADLFCTVHFLYQGPPVRMLSRRPKQKAFWLEALWIQRWQEKHPLLGEVCHGGMASFPWFHWFLLDGDLHQDIRMIEDLKEECVPDHGSV